MTDYYKLLGVPSQASPDEIRSAFRERAKRLHPDANPGLQGAARERNNQQFVQLAQAYEALRDPGRRSAYDREWRVRYGRSTGGGTASGRTSARSDGTSTRAGSRTRPPGGNARPPGGSTSPPQGDLDDLLQDLEALFRGMGLDLRQPVERLLETLVDWAKAVFQSTLGAWEAGAPEQDASRPSGSTGTKANPSSSGPEPGTDGRTRSRAAGTRPRPRAGSAGTPPHRATPQDLDAELARLKADVRSGRTRSTPSPEEAELQRIKARLREAHKRP